MEICRACMNCSVSLVNIFSEQPLPDYQYSLADVVNEFVEFKIENDDKLPQKMCLSCSLSAQNAFRFKHMFEQSYMLLMKNKRDVKVDCVLDDNKKQNSKTSQVVQKNTTSSDIIIATLERNLVNKIEQELEDDSVVSKNTTTNEHLKTSWDETNQEQKDADVIYEISSSEDQESESESDMASNISSSIDRHEEIASNDWYDKRDINSSISMEKDFLGFNLDDEKEQKESYQSMDLQKNIFPKSSSNASCNQIRKRPHKCDQCPKTYINRKGLRYHKHAHTGERPYQCSKCPSAFKTSTHLKKHNYVHTGERPFQCSYCSNGFTSSWNLKEHIQHNHNDEC